MKKWFTLLIGLATVHAASGQVFGGNPPSLKWRQLHSDTARIIFPSGLDSSAARVSELIHRLAASNPNALGNRVRQINVVLQNQTTIANGYVQLGPYRSEFFMTPELNNFSQGSISWTDQLALHEYRHVQQFNNFHHGLSSLMKTLFGEDGYTLAINASIPDWFYEGDAVYQETVLSAQGRGRLPHFVNAYPSVWQAGKKYSWMKLRNGSLKDFVPNHYHLGYLLVNYGYSKYGDDFWGKVTRDASAFKGLVYPFQRAIEKHAGVGYATFRREAFEYYRTSSSREVLEGEALFPQRKEVVEDYLFPYRIGPDSLVYVKTSYRQRPLLVIRDKQGEHRLRALDIAMDDQFSYRNGKIVYAAYESDPRWGWRDYGVIRIVDMATGNQHTLTRKTKYFTPDISPDGQRVAAVELTESGKSEIHILDAATGEKLARLHSAEIAVFTDPKFIDDNTLVTAVRLRDGKMCLAKADIRSGAISRLTVPSYNVVGYPCVQDGIVYFTANYGGNDDLFALRLGDQKLFRITNGSLGHYYVNVYQDRLTWSVPTADGYQLRQMVTDPANWKEISAAEAEALQSKFPVTLHQGDGNMLAGKNHAAPAGSSVYKKGTRLLNFHSWRPYYSQPEFTYSLYGENVLNTLQTELYYTYNENEKTHGTGFSTVYGALFPNLSLGTEYTFDRNIAVGNRIRRWDQLDTRIGLNLPLFYAGGQTYKSFNAGSYYVYRQDYNKGFYKDSLGNTSFSYLLHTLSFTQQIERAVQHLFPRFAWSITANHRHAISSVKGFQFLGSGALYLPGLLSNHHLVLNGSIQERDTLGQLVFSNRFPYSRGYEGRYFSRMWRLSANYHFPLWHPDWGFGNILYLQRFRANAFYDFTKVYSRDKTQTRDQRSVGGEFYVDTKWWNQYPLTFGFRISRLLDPDQFNGFKGTRYEFILPVSIIPR